MDLNWVVECDDEVWSFRTRAQAREYARRLNRHPANAGIRQCGGYRNVDGVARVYARDVYDAIKRDEYQSDYAHDW